MEPASVHEARGRVHERGREARLRPCVAVAHVPALRRAVTGAGQQAARARHRARVDTTRTYVRTHTRAHTHEYTHGV